MSSQAARDLSISMSFPSLSKVNVDTYGHPTCPRPAHHIMPFLPMATWIAILIKVNLKTVTILFNVNRKQVG